ncbi:sulfatase [Hominifimenecus sp. rT4P-3]|uniref:sulfatase n=1 Tax=Hominifimenecus sp. rT4P-3 TaxID=3242979 RepID=UPI003DA52952
MKAIMVMFDSLNRRLLPNYGCDWTHAPNFKRLSERMVTFDNCFVGSMPCMPARRELHTGRYNFLHRCWGPVEPYDDSMPEMLKEAGIYTHLITDHAHYWEDGGATFHERYNSFEFIRGQEGDAYLGQIKDPVIPPSVEMPGKMGGRNLSKYTREDWINRAQVHSEEDFPMVKTFQKGLSFMERNADQDNWFLQIETFDPHEPFHSPQKYKDYYPHGYQGKHFDWPPYTNVEQTPEEVEHCKYEYAALLSMCDEYLGRFLDKMDELNLWDDTMVIVNTDHGFLLGEHGWWAKCVAPFYNEVAHIPMFIWDPRSRTAGERRESLVQNIDLVPTLLNYFGLEPTKDMMGKDLTETIRNDQPVREALLFGIHGGHVNCTDGRYVYMRGWVEGGEQYNHNYTLVPMHIRTRFSVEELRQAELVDGFSFTKDCRVLKVPGTGTGSKPRTNETFLFDLEKDPGQQNPIQDREIEEKMLDYLVKIMEENEAPGEQYQRLGIQH